MNSIHIDPIIELKPLSNSELIIADSEDNKCQLVRIESNLKEFKIRKKQERLDDYDRVRDNMLYLLEEGKDLFQSCKRLAEQSDQSRAYEVAGNILRTLVDTNKQLLDNQTTVDTIIQFEEDEESENKEIEEKENKSINITTNQLLDLILNNSPKKESNA